MTTVVCCFVSKTIQKHDGAARVADAIRDLFVVDPHIGMTALKVAVQATAMMLTRKSRRAVQQPRLQNKDSRQLVVVWIDLAVQMRMDDWIIRRRSRGHC